MAEVQFIHISPEMAYPVGHYIKRNLPAIEAQANTLYKLYSDKKVYLWCRGSSGSMIAAIVAQKFDRCTICHIKKEGEKSHTNYYPRVYRTGVHIIIDDFISMGNTVNNIYETIHKSWKDISIDCLCVTGVVYSDRIHFVPKIIIGKTLYKGGDEHYHSGTYTI